MESAAILVVNSFESNSVGKGRWVSPKKQVLCFRLKWKALYLGRDAQSGREMLGVPWLRSCFVVKVGVEPSSRQRSVRLGWTRHITLPLLIWTGEAGGRTPQVQVSIPAPSSATTSPPSDHVINTCFTNTIVVVWFYMSSISLLGLWGGLIPYKTNNCPLLGFIVEGDHYKDWNL